MRPIRIVLADDHELTRQGTRHMLEQSAYAVVVGEAGTGEQTLDLVNRLRPDLAIIDVRMPGLNGIEVVRQMKAASPRTEAVILTAFDDDEYVLALMQAGALGYLLKTARPSALVDAIRRVHAGEPVLDPAVAAKVWRLWPRQRSGLKPQPAEQLTPRELDVLLLAARGMRNKGIADRLGISIRTVDGHFHSVLVKIGVSSRVEAILFAISHDLVSLPENSTEASSCVRP